MIGGLVTLACARELRSVSHSIRDFPSFGMQPREEEFVEYQRCLLDQRRKTPPLMVGSPPLSLIRRSVDSRLS